MVSHNEMRSPAMSPPFLLPEAANRQRILEAYKGETGKTTREDSSSRTIHKGRPPMDETGSAFGSAALCASQNAGSGYTVGMALSSACVAPPAAVENETSEPVGLNPMAPRLRRRESDSGGGYLWEGESQRSPPAGLAIMPAWGTHHRTGVLTGRWKTMRQLVPPIC